MRLDQQIREAKVLQDQMSKIGTAFDQMPKINNTAFDQISKINTAFDQMSRANTIFGRLRANNTVLDQMAKSQVDTVLDQLRVNTVLDQSRANTIFGRLRANNTVLDQMAKSQVDTVLDQLRVNTVLDQSRANTIFGRLRANNTVLDQMAKSQVDTVLDQLRVNTVLDQSRANTIFGRLRANNTVLDQMAGFKTLQDVEDRISRFTTFSDKLSPFVEEAAADLLKEEAVPNQKMTDEVKKQVEDLFKELENEEVADEVEFLEWFWCKVREKWSKIPDWSKNCLVTIIWSIAHIYLSAYNILPQISYQSTVPTTIVSKPVIKIIKKAKRQGLHLPSEYRIVTASKLNVRERPKRHSDIRGTLFAGDLVMIKKKKKNWSLVEYSNEETHIKIQGWVFTRYLRKIN